MGEFRRVGPPPWRRRRGHPDARRDDGSRRRPDRQPLVRPGRPPWRPPGETCSPLRGSARPSRTTRLRRSRPLGFPTHVRRGDRRAAWPRPCGLRVREPTPGRCLPPSSASDGADESYRRSPRPLRHRVAPPRLRGAGPSTANSSSSAKMSSKSESSSTNQPATTSRKSRCTPIGHRAPWRTSTGTRPGRPAGWSRSSRAPAPAGPPLGDRAGALPRAAPTLHGAPRRGSRSRRCASAARRRPGRCRPSTGGPGLPHRRTRAAKGRSRPTRGGPRRCPPSSERQAAPTIRPPRHLTGDRLPERRRQTGGAARDPRRGVAARAKTGSWSMADPTAVAVCGPQEPVPAGPLSVELGLTPRQVQHHFGLVEEMIGEETIGTVAAGLVGSHVDSRNVVRSAHHAQAAGAPSTLEPRRVGEQSLHVGHPRKRKTRKRKTLRQTPRHGDHSGRRSRPLGPDTPSEP